MKKYPKYKETEVKGIASIPKDWVISKIKFISKTIAGGTPDTKNVQFWENGTIPWLPSGKVQDCNIYEEDADTFITELGLKGSAAKLIPTNSILIALTGATCANIAHLHFSATANQSVVAMPGSKKIENRFLFYCLLGIRECILINKTGGAQSGINDGNIKNTQIPYPSLPEQHSIVQFLDHKTGQIDRFIAKRQKQIELLKERKAAIINKTVTKGINPNAKMKDSGIDWIGEVPEHWEIVKLKYLTKKIGSGVTPLGGSEVYKSEGVAFFRSQNIYNDRFELSNISFIDEETHIGMKNSKVVTGDVLLNITGASIGRCFYYSGEYIEANVNQHVCVIRSNRKILFHFLHFVMISEIGQNQIFSKQSGTNREGLNFEQLKLFNIPLPSNEEQLSIIEFLKSETSTINTLITKYQKQTELMQEYRTALISQAVTGKIDVREWNAKPKTYKTEAKPVDMAAEKTNEYKNQV